MKKKGITMINYNTNKSGRRFGATLVAASLAMPLLAGCGGTNNQSNMTPVDDTRANNASYNPPAPSAPSQGMSTKQKVILVAGAAALYWLYKHQKDAQGNSVQYYQSKNGRIYYRDAEHRAHWVTPPREVTATPEEERELSRFQGYNDRSTGEQFNGFQQESSY
jgi:hypothetical protein